jgi:molybdopterin molybdotransferase
MPPSPPPAPLLPVADALARILASATPTAVEPVPLLAATGRVLAAPLAARLTQPPFDASAMDGYAVRAADLTTIPARLRVIGSSAAGHAFAGTVAAGEAARIFTGAPMPAGADTVVIQENTGRDGDTVVIRQAAAAGANVRRRGFDFAEGTVLIEGNRRLTARDVALAASMGHGVLPVRRRPVIALIATGDELVEPGTVPAKDQIVSSVPYGLAGLIAAAGGEARHLGIARDRIDDIARLLDGAAGADVIVTIGGASVGDHDLVQRALVERGAVLDFWKIAMRPGKPMMFGRLGTSRVLGLPGNPVSAHLCARVFLTPLIRALLGEPAEPSAGIRYPLAEPIGANGPRQHYLRARLVDTDGRRHVAPMPSQDSSLGAALARADCLIVQPPDAPALPPGAEVDVLPLD